MEKDLVTWDNSFNLGLGKIDEQHQLLLILVNKIWRAIIGRADRKHIFALVKELEVYSIIHFAEEEAYMLKVNYPNIDKHKKIHKQFIKRVAMEKAIAIREGHLSLDILHFLRDWLVNHIKGSDMRFSEYVKEQDKNNAGSVGRFFKRIIGAK